MQRWIATALGLVMLFATAPSTLAADQTITTGDGLALTLGGDAVVRRIKVGSRTLPTSGPGGFSLRRVGGTPNLVPNSSFEYDGDRNGIPDGWSITGAGSRPSTATGEAHTSSRSVRIHNSRRGDSARMRIDVPVRPNTAYSLSAWFRTYQLEPSGPRANTVSFPIPGRITVGEIVGSSTRFAGTLFSYTDTTDWHRRVLALRTGPSTRAVEVSLKIGDGSGTVWFDDVTLREVLQPTSTRIGGTLSKVGANRIRQEATIAGGLRLDARYTASEDRIAIEGSIRSTSSADVPLELSYTLPVNATGWSWHDDARNRRTIAAGSSHSYETRLQPQTTSRYPWSTIGDHLTSLSMGLPLDTPRIQRVRYTPGGLTISFDLGLSPRATLLGPVATFSFVVFTSPPAWGYRAATKDYYRMYPQFFERRTDPAREGGWGARVDYGAWADRTKDFGIGLDMVPSVREDDGSAALLRKDDREGIYSVIYNHHWGYKEKQETFGTFPTYAAAVQGLVDAANGPRDTPQQRVQADRAQAALNSTSLDLNGQRIYEGYAYQGLSGPPEFFVNWYEDLDPLPDVLDWSTVSRMYQVDSAVRAAAAAGVELDGIHMDSTSGMQRWAATDDYSPAHWAAAEMPLTFSYASTQVTKRTLFTDYAQLVRTSDHAHALGMIFSANYNSTGASALGWFGADVIDYFGIERGLPEKALAEPYNTIDSLALMKRTMANQRPVSTFDYHVSDGSLTSAEIEDRLQLNLFYGIYAGIAGGPHLTEATRQLYLRYTPLFREINTAGWEPVTWATTSASGVWLERFGAIEDGPQFLTLRNTTSAQQQATVDFSVRRSGIDPAELAARERLSGTDLAIQRVAPDTGRFTITVPAGATRVVKIRRA